MGIWVVFTSLDIMNNIVMNICVQVLVWIYVFISLEYMPRVELLGCVVILCLII